LTIRTAGKGRWREALWMGKAAVKVSKREGARLGFAGEQDEGVLDSMR